MIFQTFDAAQASRWGGILICQNREDCNESVNLESVERICQIRQATYMLAAFDDHFILPDVHNLTGERHKLVLTPITFIKSSKQQHPPVPRGVFSTHQVRAYPIISSDDSR